MKIAKSLTVMTIGKVEAPFVGAKPVCSFLFMGQGNGGKCLKHMHGIVCVLASAYLQLYILTYMHTAIHTCTHTYMYTWIIVCL